MTLDEFEALKMCAAEELWWAAPASWTFPPLQSNLRIWASRDEEHDYAPLLRFLMLVTAGSPEGRWFPLRLPVKGKSNTG